MRMRVLSGQADIKTIHEAVAMRSLELALIGHRDWATSMTLRGRIDHAESPGGNIGA